MTIMIVSNVEDVHAHAVMKACALERCCRTARLIEFSTRLALSMSFEDGARRFVLTRPDGGRLDLSAIGAVWWRRPQPFRLPAAVTDPTQRRFAMSEATTAWQGLYQALDVSLGEQPGVRLPPRIIKPWQLALAQEIGLSIPVTLMTNDPESTRVLARMRAA